jgi:hypothetical protein
MYLPFARHHSTRKCIFEALLSHADPGDAAVADDNGLVWFRRCSSHIYAFATGAELVQDCREFTALEQLREPFEIPSKDAIAFNGR